MSILSFSNLSYSYDKKKKYLVISAQKWNWEKYMRF